MVRENRVREVEEDTTLAKREQNEMHKRIAQLEQTSVSADEERQRLEKANRQLLEELNALRHTTKTQDLPSKDEIGEHTGNEPCVIYAADKPPFGTADKMREDVPVRIHDQCMTSEVFGSKRYV